MHAVLLAGILLLAGEASGGGTREDGTAAPYTLQAAVAAVGAGDYLPVDPGAQSSVALAVTITGTATVTIEASPDSSSWNALAVRNDATGAYATTITASGAYHVDSSGWSYVQARVSAYTSGTVTVTATRQPGPIDVGPTTSAPVGTCADTTNTALSGTSEVVFAANATRKSVTITNNDATIAIYVRQGGTATTASPRVPAGSSWSIEIEGGTIWTGTIDAIAASGTPSISAEECY